MGVYCSCCWKKIVVLGGDGEGRELKSVESFNFERNTWQELPEMSQARYWHTAVVVWTFLRMLN